MATILQISEMRWSKIANGNIIIYSGISNENTCKKKGVALMLDGKATKELLECKSVYVIKQDSTIPITE